MGLSFSFVGELGSDFYPFFFGGGARGVGVVEKKRTEKNAPHPVDHPKKQQHTKKRTHALTPPATQQYKIRVEKKKNTRHSKMGQVDHQLGGDRKTPKKKKGLPGAKKNMPKTKPKNAPKEPDSTPPNEKLRKPKKETGYPPHGKKQGLRWEGESYPPEPKRENDTPHPPKSVKNQIRNTKKKKHLR